MLTLSLVSLISKLILRVHLQRLSNSWIHTAKTTGEAISAIMTQDGNAIISVKSQHRMVMCVTLAMASSTCLSETLLSISTQYLRISAFLTLTLLSSWSKTMSKLKVEQEVLAVSAVAVIN